METQMKQIMEDLESFYQEGNCNVVATMESMLFDWYQHYALEHYPREHITEVVNDAFRVNDLLLKLREAIRALKAEQGSRQAPVGGEHLDYHFAI